MKFDIFEAAREHVIVAAHRGTAAGNIPCNTMPAYEMALKSGADMIEIDVEMSADGVLYIFHPRMERAHLGIDTFIKDMHSSEVNELRYRNFDNAETQFKINTFDEVMEAFKGRCFINVDKFWGHPEEIYRAIKRHGVMDQIIVKSTIKDDVLSVLKEVAPDIAFMPVVSSSHPCHDELMKSGINYIGAEVLFFTDEDEVVSERFIDMMHRDEKLLWVNPIIYNYKKQIAAGHSDDRAIMGDPDGSWGFLAKRGFDILQTDWVAPLIDYLKKNSLYYR